MPKAFSQLRQNIELFFAAWSDTVVQKPWTVLLISLVLTFSVIPLVRHGWIDVSIESFLPDSNQALNDYNEFRNSFNYAPGALVVLDAQQSVFNLETLNKIRAFHEAIEQRLPYLLKVTSLANVRYTRGEEDEMIVGDLSEIWPTTEAEIPAFKEIVLNNENYLGAIISENQQVLNFLIDPKVYSTEKDPNQPSGLSYLKPEEEEQFSKAVVSIVEEFNQADFVLYHAGGPTMNYMIANDMQESTGRSTGLGFAVIILLLFMLFRRLSGVILPLLVVFLSLAITFAMWPTLGYPFNGNTQIIPTIFLAVGIGDAIYILSIFYKYYDNGEEKRAAITHAIKETAIAVLLTTVTTSIGLMSFYASEIMPTRSLGLFGAIGVISALFYTLVLVPSLLTILPIKRRTQASGDHAVEKTGMVLRGVDKVIAYFSWLGVHHAKKVVAVSSLISVIALIGVMQVRLDHDPVRWYPKEHPLRKGIELVDKEMDGMLTAHITIDFKQDHALHDPKVLQAIEQIELLVENYPHASVNAVDATSILSVVKETHQALNANQPDYFAIPESQQMVAQELLLFESGSDDLFKYSDFKLQMARFDVQFTWSNVLNYREYVIDIRDAMQAELARLGYPNAEVKFVGLLAIFGEALYTLLTDTMQSYLIAFAFVFLVMVLLMGNIRHGLIAFIPNVIPILITVGLVSHLDIALNIITSTLGCVIIGIAVDDTIHFMHHFRRYSETFSPSVAIEKTLQTCGRAIFFTSVVLVGGFIVHLSGTLSTNKEFGWMLSTAIILALLANLILAPALIMQFWGKQPNKASDQVSIAEDKPENSLDQRSVSS